MKKQERDISFEENPLLRIADRIHGLPTNIYFLLKNTARTNSTINYIANILGFDKEIGMDEQCRTWLNKDGKQQLYIYKDILLNHKNDVKSLQTPLEEVIKMYQQVLIWDTYSTEIVAGDYLEYIRKLSGNRNTLAEWIGEHIYFSQQTKQEAVSIGAKSLLRLSNFVSMMQKIKSNNYLFDPTKKSIT